MKFPYFFFAAVLIAACGCASAGSYSLLLPLEQSLIYQTAPDPNESHVPDGATDVWFSADDGTRLHGRLFEHPQCRAVVLFCHGNAGSVESWSAVGKELKDEHQCTVLVFDYRGYGKSEGVPTEEGLLRDAQAARRWLAQRTGVENRRWC